MSEQPAIDPDEAEFVPDPEKEKQAKAVHFTVSIIRLLGVVIVMLGIAITMEKLPPTPPVAGYVLIVLGLFQMWFLPVWMIRRYVKARVAEEEMQKREKTANE